MAPFLFLVGRIIFGRRLVGVGYKKIMILINIKRFCHFNTHQNSANGKNY
jgi:hypothetical protein